MGQKDYQQCMVVKRLIHLMGWKITFHRCPIVREADGLAMSSRNVRLNPDERQRATAIYKALLSIVNAGSPNTASPTTTSSIALSPNTSVPHAQQILEDAQFKIDYIAIADAETLEPVEPGSAGAVTLIAAFQGEVRLIDNMFL
jgi:pantoate--beta-alanine ligase